MKHLALPHGVHTLIVVLAILVGGAAALAFFGGQENPVFTSWVNGGLAQVHSHGPYLKRLAAWQATATAARAEAVHLAIDTALKRWEIDSLLQASTTDLAQTGDTAAVRRGVTELRRAAETCSVELARCQKRNAKLQIAATADSARAEDATRHSIVSDSLLKIGLHVKDCRLLHVAFVRVGCPSRKTSLKIGVVLGVVILESLRLVTTGHP